MAVTAEIQEALNELSPAVLRGLGSVPVEVLDALREVPVEALRALQAGGMLPPAEEAARSTVFTGSDGDELTRALEHVDEVLKRTDANVVMCFGKFRNLRTSQAWWNGWIDSGGGGVSRLLDLPDYEVAQVFAVLGSEVRLAILRSLLETAKSAAELVAALRLGTTGQAYHHLQELIRTGFVAAKDGQYHFNGGRTRAYFTALAVAADLVPSPGEANARDEQS